MLARTEDALGGGVTAIRLLRLLRADPSWAYGDGKAPGESLWPDARAFLVVDSMKVHDGVVIERDQRMYVASLDPDALTPDPWLLLVRSHWGVENHHTLDTAFAEDERPWIEADATGMLAVLLLRRIAYTSSRSIER